MRGYDYSTPGFYYVTICVEGKRPILGTVAEGEMVIRKTGQVVKRCWEILPQRFLSVKPDAFVVMPNHVHGIVELEPPVGVGLALPRAWQAPPLRMPALSDVVGTFKSTSAIAMNRLLRRSGRPVWPRNYYERVIRYEKDLEMARLHITQDPLRWMLDRENPKAHVPNIESECSWIT